ncbi:MAG TPA: GNAT family protein [Blastocatellia bacterium]|nr:GNAT family protein [Blastocatellia bacterium]
MAMSVEPITLEGAHIRLAPLSMAHHAQLCEIGLDERLWRSTTIQLQTSEDMFKYIQTALQNQAEGNALPFVIIEKDSDKLVGTTRYHSINRAHRRLEIGFTWIAVEWQRTRVNTEAKYLMLKHAFEQCKCVRVEFKADSRNQRSSRALIRIGAKQEGVLRKYMVSDHKGTRDLALFSIIDTEWPEVKANLERKLTSR